VSCLPESLPLTSGIAPAFRELPPTFEAPHRATAPSNQEEENFAEAADEFRVNFSEEKRHADKTFVSAVPERLTPHGKTLGIDVAKRATTMPSRAPSTPTPHPVSEYTATAVPVAREMTPLAVSEGSVAAPQDVATAHRAVETVLRAVDHAATHNQHSVNLRFSVGDAELNVRVELRADEVRTTFTTDSAELRSALSHEWQALAHASADGAIRIAPAAFTSASDQPSSQTFSGDASSRDREQHFQQQQQHRASRDAQEIFTQSRTGATPLSGRVGSEGRTEIRPAARHAGSRHLHTLA
jgi:hypothetical protein